MDQHALAVDIGDLEVGDLAGAQAGAIRRGQCRFVFECGGRFEQALHFIGTEYHGQLAWFVNGAHLAQYLAIFQGDLEEKSQPCDGDIDRLAGNAVTGQMQLKSPKVFRGGGMR